MSTFSGRTLTRLLTERTKVLAEARSISTEVAEGTRPDNAESEASFQHTQREYERLETEIVNARSDAANERDDEEQREQFSKSLSGSGRTNIDMQHTPQLEARFGRPLGQNRWADLVPDSRTLEDAGEWVRATMLDDISTRAAMVEATGTHGAALVPEQLLSPILDKARSQMVLQAAGASYVPLSSMTATLPVHTGDPEFLPRLESGPMHASDVSIEGIVLTPASFSAVLVVSSEILEDASTNIAAYLGNVIAEAAAHTVDKAGLYSNTTDPVVKGLRYQTGVNIVPTATNGLTITGYDQQIDAVARLRAKDYEPTAVIGNPRTAATQAKFREGSGTGLYLAPPVYLSEIPHFYTTAVPVSLTQGTSTDCSDILVGDFRHLVVGVRSEMRLQRLDQLYAVSSGSIGLLATMRFCIAVSRADAFEIVSGVRAA